MLVTGLQWLSEDVTLDQGAGLCIRKESGDSKVSCWEATKSDINDIYNGYIFYLTDRDVIANYVSDLR